MTEREGLDERIGPMITKVAHALSLGKNVLVHSMHGIHRSGSFVVFLMSMMLRMACAQEQPDWDDIFDWAWFLGEQAGADSAVQDDAGRGRGPPP